MSLETRSLGILRLDGRLEEKAAALALLWNNNNSDEPLLNLSGVFSVVLL
jgi:hypothetical protein